MVYLSHYRGIVSRGSKLASKHYYMGSQRIASELIGQPQDLDSLFNQGQTQGSKMQTGPHYPTTVAMGAQSVWANMDTLIQRLGMQSDANFWDGLIVSHSFFP